jgi:hypothetical protein
MTTCLMIGATILTLAAPEFTLRWTHSVEKTDWAETWHVDGPLLRLTRVAIKGSGAGMEPADDARLENGWWVWNPDLALSALNLASSGATGAGWHLCSGGACHDIGTEAGDALTLQPCGG